MSERSFFGKVEKREKEPAWEEWSLLGIHQDHAQHLSEHYRRLVIYPSNPEYYVPKLFEDSRFALQTSLERERVPPESEPLSTEERKNIEDMLEILSDPHLLQKITLLRRSRSVTDKMILQSLHKKHAEVDTRHFYYPKEGVLPPHTKNRLAAVEPQDLQPGIRYEHCRKNILSISNTHASTGDIFLSIREAGWEFDSEKTGVLSFDHHGDTYDSRELGKASVMRYVLEQKLVKGVFVVGVYSDAYSPPVEGAEFMMGKNLYKDGVPDSGMFTQAWKAKIQNWKSEGIRQFYLSVDMDGLQVDTLGLHATDYSPLRRVLDELIALSSYRDAFSVYGKRKHVDPETWGRWKQCMLPLKGTIDQLKEPYQGMPAHWITGAIQMARAEGLKLGVEIRHPSNPAQDSKRIIGDIVEVANNDPRRHVQRLTTSLVESIVTLAEAK